MPLLSIEPQTIELPALNLVGCVAHAAFMEGDNWPLLPECWERIGPYMCQPPQGHIHPERNFGMSVYPASFEQDKRWYYGAYMQVDTLERPYPGLMAQHIPAASYFAFTVEGPVTEIAPAFREIHEKWMPSAAGTLAGWYDLELYAEEFRGPDDPQSRMNILLPKR